MGGDRVYATSRRRTLTEQMHTLISRAGRLNRGRRASREFPTPVIVSMVTLSTIKTVLNQGLAFAEMDFRQATRFRVNFFANLFLNPLINLGMFGTVFFGFLRTSPSGTAGLTQENFVVFTVLGALAATLYNQGQGAFQVRLTAEKYWQTASALLASPFSPWAYLLGVGISELSRFFISAVVFLALAYLIWPVGIVTLFQVIFSLIILYVIVSGISLIRGAVELVNENIDPIFFYFLLGTGYLSCFYFPVSFVPSFLQPFALINPIYSSVYLIRAAWLQLPFSPEYFLGSLLAAGLSAIIGTYGFTKIWRRLDVTGY